MGDRGAEGWGLRAGAKSWLLVEHGRVHGACMLRSALPKPRPTSAALLCLHDAEEGGISHWASSVAVHNALLRRGRKVGLPRR